MEAALAVIVSGLLLSPLVFVLIAFRIIFPRHALRIKEVFLVPVALLIVVVFDSYQIFLLFKWLPADTKSLTDVWTWLRSLPLNNFGDFLNSVYFVLSLCLIPFLFTLLGSWIANFCYGWIYKTKKLSPSGLWRWVLIFLRVTLFPFELLAKILAGLVKNQILNHFGQATAFDKKNEQLMVDILSADGFLYSGIYSDFFMEDGAFVGLSVTNILRYRYRFDESGKKIETELYLIPNSGELFIPNDQIKNIHFWKLSRVISRTEDLNSDYSATYIAWIISVFWSSDIQTSPKIKIKKDLEATHPSVIKKFVKEMVKTRVPVSYLSVPEFY